MEQNQLMPNDYLIAQGLIWRSELSYAGVAAAGVAYTGITVGADEVVILQRSYTSSESILTVELFEATFTGGTDPRTLNRRFKNNGDSKPAIVKVGVTPGTLTSPITGVTLRAAASTGSAQLSVAGDDSRLYLEAGKNYVVRYTNGGATTATISNAFDFRKAFVGLWERVIGSL